MGVIGLILIILNVNWVYKAFRTKDKSKYVQLVVSIITIGIISYIVLPSVTKPSLYLRYNNLIAPVEDYRDQISDKYSMTLNMVITDSVSPYKERNIEERATGTGLWWKEINTDNSKNNVLITIQADTKADGRIQGTIYLDSEGFGDTESKTYEILGTGNNLKIELDDGTTIDASDWLKSMIRMPSDDDMTAMSKTVASDSLSPLVSLIDKEMAESIQGYEMEWVSDVMFPTKENRWFEFIGDSAYAENISYIDSETGKKHNLNIGVQRRFEFEQQNHKRGGTKGQYFNGILNQIGLYETDNEFVPSLTTGGIPEE